MSNDLYDNGPNDKRSYNDYSWIDNLGWKRRAPRGTQWIYDFAAYRRFCKHANEEEIWKLHKLWDKNGLHSAISDMLMELGTKKFNAFVQKDNFINQQLNKQSVSTYELEEQFQEQERWKNLSENDRRLKCMEQPVAPGCAAAPIRAEDIMSQMVLEDEIGDDGIGYRVYDKLYNFYSVVVFSPMRYRSEGPVGHGEIIRRRTRRQLEGVISEAVAKERQLYREYLDRGRVSTTTTQPLQSTKKVSNNVNIDHVRKAMGLQADRLNNDLNGDIF